MDLKATLGDAYKEGMTLEEIETALANVEMFSQDDIDKRYVPKATADKYASEAAKYRKERNTLNNDKTALEQRVAGLEKASDIARYTNKYAAQGMSAEDAATAAQAMVDGDTDKVFELQSKLLADVKEKAVSDKMKEMGTPPAGNRSQEISDEDLAKQLQEAYASGNMLRVVTLTRVQNERAHSKH